MSKVAAASQATPGSRQAVEIPVVRTVSGQDVTLTAHVVRGKRDGPTMVVLGGMHGDETGSFSVIRTFFEDLDPMVIRGTVVVLPIANPLALGAMSRFTPDLHGTTDLHAVFPGSQDGTLTQKIAAAIHEHLILGLTEEDAFIDIHSGGAGGRLQFRVDYDTLIEGSLRRRTVTLCRAFGTFLIHENKLAGTSSRVANAQGVPTVNVEVGGAYLDEPTDREFTDRGVAGLRSVAGLLGILDTPAPAPTEQWVYDSENRIEVNPRSGGYLVSRVPHLSDLDRLIAEGELLGEVIDPYTLQVTDQLVAPVGGFLFFTRRSGIVEAGAKVFGLARREGAKCL